ncbi:MAG: hypothetical protein FJX06_18285 [Alphaproteobacteria bacterium]|nr:hypothetical protein [Alphaproteobacteria bacterium]
MYADLRTAIEAAEFKKQFALSDDDVHEIERAVIAWMREQAGEDVKAAIENGLREVYGIGDEYPQGELPYYAKDKLEAIESRVLPLFAALRLRAEEAERCATESAEIMRRARESRDALREIARKALEEGYPTLDKSEVARIANLYQAALRAIAGEKEEA